MLTNICESVNRRELTPTKLVNHSRFKLPNYFQITTLYTNRFYKEMSTRIYTICQYKNHFMVGVCCVFGDNL